MKRTRSLGSGELSRIRSLLDFDRTSSGEDLPGRQTAVLDDEPASLLISPIPVLIDKRMHLSVNRFLEHLPSPFLNDLV